MTIGERIKFIRKKHKFNQSDLANALGISQTHISKIESNKDNPSINLILSISKLFNVNAEWLNFGTGEVSENDEEITLAEITIALNKLYEDSDELERSIVLITLKQMLEIFKILKETPNIAAYDHYFCFSDYFTSIHNLLMHLHSSTNEIHSNEEIGKKIDEIFAVTNMYTEQSVYAIEHLRNIFLGNK